MGSNGIILKYKIILKKRSFSKNKNLSAFMCTHTCINRGSSWWAECLSGIQEKVVLLKVSRRNWVCLCIALCTVCPWRRCDIAHSVAFYLEECFHRNKSKSSKLSFLAHSWSYSLGRTKFLCSFRDMPQLWMANLMTILWTKWFRTGL